MFREEKSPEDEIKAWQFWHSRQHSVKQRILDAGKVWHSDHKILKKAHNWNKTKKQNKRKKRSQRRGQRDMEPRAHHKPGKSMNECTTTTTTKQTITERASFEWVGIRWNHALAINWNSDFITCAHRNTHTHIYLPLFTGTRKMHKAQNFHGKRNDFAYCNQYNLIKQP